jgi:hypothetical protein
MTFLFNGHCNDFVAIALYTSDKAKANVLYRIHGGFNMTKNLLIEKILAPLNGAKYAKVDINAGDGNLTIDNLTGGEQVLANGTLQYFEKQGSPTQAQVSNNSQTTLTVKGGSAGQPWFRLPWSACNGATEWQIHLNPTVSSDLTTHSDGGNIKLG